MKQWIAMNVRIEVSFFTQKNLKVGTEKYRSDQSVVVLYLEKDCRYFVENVQSEYHNQDERRVDSFDSSNVEI
jgi:hypothetical protein